MGIARSINSVRFFQDRTILINLVGPIRNPHAQWQRVEKSVKIAYHEENSMAGMACCPQCLEFAHIFMYWLVNQKYFWVNICGRPTFLYGIPMFVAQHWWCWIPLFYMFFMLHPYFGVKSPLLVTIFIHMLQFSNRFFSSIFASKMQGIKTSLAIVGRWDGHITKRRVQWSKIGLVSFRQVAMN